MFNNVFVNNCNPYGHPKHIVNDTIQHSFNNSKVVFTGDFITVGKYCKVFKTFKCPGCVQLARRLVQHVYWLFYKPPTEVKLGLVVSSGALFLTKAAVKRALCTERSMTVWWSVFGLGNGQFGVTAGSQEGPRPSGSEESQTAASAGRSTTRQYCILKYNINCSGGW